MGCLQPRSQQTSTNEQITEKEQGQKSQGDQSSKQSILDWTSEFKNVKNLIQNNAPSAFSQFLDKSSDLAVLLVLIIQLRKAQTR